MPSPRPYLLRPCGPKTERGGKSKNPCASPQTKQPPLLSRPHGQYNADGRSGRPIYGRCRRWETSGHMGGRGSLSPLIVVVGCCGLCQMRNGRAVQRAKTATLFGGCQSWVPLIFSWRKCRKTNKPKRRGVKNFENPLFGQIFFLMLLCV